MASKGVTYIVFGKHYVDECLFSAKSVKENGGDFPVTVFTDTPFQSEYVDTVSLIQDRFYIDYFFRSTKRFPSSKIWLLRQSPYDLTVYLDSDTFVKRNMAGLFDYLRDSDLGLTKHAGVRYEQVEPGKFRVSEFRTLSMENWFNCGVLAFRKGAAADLLFDLWLAKFIEAQAGEHRHGGNWEGGVNEQQIMNEYLYNSGLLEQKGVKVAKIPNIIYNAVMVMWPRLYASNLWDDVVVLHCHNLEARIKEFGVEGLPHIADIQAFR